MMADTHSHRAGAELMGALAQLTVLTSVLGFFGALGIWGWQLFTYLKTGIEPSLSVIEVMRSLHIEWAYSPSDWLGIYKILDWLPFSGALFLLSLVSIWMFDAADYAARQARHK